MVNVRVRVRVGVRVRVRTRVTGKFAVRRRLTWFERVGLGFERVGLGFAGRVSSR